MTHYDERTLELYVLGAPEVNALRTRVEDHLRVCEGCRKLQGELEVYYRTAGAANAELLERSTEALVVRAAGVETPDWRDAVHPERRLPLHARVALFALRRPATTAVSFFGMAALLALGISFLRFPTAGSPEHLRAENGALVVMDRDGRELWRRYLGPELTADRLTDDTRACVALRNVDGTPRAEVLIAGGTFTGWPGRNVLVCLGPDGEELWRYEVHREMIFGDESFSDAYAVQHVWAEDFDGDGTVEVVAVATTSMYYPCVVLTLDGRSGVHRAEYWHAGTLAAGVVFTGDRGAGKRLLLVGENNGYNRAVLVALDPARMTGHGPAPEAYTPRGVPDGNASAYLLFPRSDLNLVTGRRPGGRTVLSDGPGSVLIQTREFTENQPFELLFHLDSLLTCWKVVPNDLHLAEHRRLLAAGKLTREPDAAYLDELRLGVRYWNGREFVGRLEWATPPP